MPAAQRLALILAGLAVLAGVAFVSLRAGSGTPPVEQAAPAASGAIYAAAVEPEQGMPAIGEMKDWILTLRNRDDTPVEGATVGIDGGMPAHRHGLPTRPQVTAELGDGRYRIEGLKFSMSGRWELRFDVSGSSGRETLTVFLDM